MPTGVGGNQAFTTERVTEGTSLPVNANLANSFIGVEIQGDTTPYKIDISSLSGRLSVTQEILGVIKPKGKGTYSAGTQYSLMDYVDSGNQHYLYIGDTPSTGIPLTDTTKWTLLVSDGTTPDTSTFLTQTTGDARYPLKTATDPYPTYLTQAEAAALFSPIGGDAQGGLRYNYVVTTGTATTGQIRFNNAALASITALSIHEIDRNSAGQSVVLDAIAIGTRINVQLEDNEEIYAWFRVSGAVVDNGSDRTIPVAFVSSAGTFAAGEVTVDFLQIQGGGGHTILDETSPLAQRSKLAFQGAGVTATDDAANDQTIITISGATGGFALRELLTAARTYYVRTDGNDTNNGQADNSGGAFLTLDRAILAVASLDLGVISPKIKLADGTYSGSTLFRTLIGAGKVLIEGNLTTPANVILTTTTGDVLYSSSGFVGVYQLKGVTINAPNNAIYINGGGFLEFGKCVLGTCGSVQLATQNSSKISIIDNYSITGDAVYHVYAIGSGAAIFYNAAPVNPVTVTFVGSRNFSAAFGIASALGLLEFDGPSYCAFGGSVASATGLRYICNENAIVRVGGAGATYLPGSTNGTPATGGQYN